MTTLIRRMRTLGLALGGCMAVLPAYAGEPADQPGAASKQVNIGAATGIAGDITWNFEKFLVGRDGRVLKRYPPETPPQDNGMLADIAAAL